MTRFLLAVLRRDLTLAARRRGDWLIAQFFFVMTASLFPLGVGPEPEMLARIGPGVLWVSATLASLLSLSRLFADDHHDGSLEHMVLSPEPTVLLVLGKSLAHWLIYGIPLLLIAPVLGIQFNLPWDAILTLEISLLLGTPILSLLGGLGAALTLGLRSGAVLLILLILPLCIPALIFGAGAVSAAEAGISTRGHFSLLGALLIGSGLLAPWATGAALRIATE